MQDDYINNEEIYEIDLREYLMIIWHKKWLIIALVAIAIIASFFLTQQMERIYQTSTLVMVQTDSGAASLFEEQLAFGGRNEKTINTYSRIFTSRLILDKVIRDVELKNEAGEYISAGALRGNISIQSGGESDLMTIEVEYNDPAIAQKIADSLVENMQYEIRELNQASLRAANEFIDSQLENTQHRLLDLEDELLDYRENNEILMPETQAQSLLSRSTELEAKLLEAEIMQEEAQLSINEINNTLESVDRDESLNRNPEITEIQSQLNTLYTELEGLKTKYTKKHPEVLNIQARIDSLEARLREKTEEIMAGRIERTDPLYSDFNNQLINLEVQMVTSEAKVNSYRDLAAEVEEELAAFPAAELHYLRLQREKNITEEIYLLLRNRKEEISIQQAMQTSDIFVIDAAHLPTNPVRPNLTLNIAIAAVLALMLAVFIIFMLEFLNNRIKNENDLENISDLPVLGIIPDLDEIDHHKNYGEEDQDEKENKKSELNSDKLVALHHIKSPATEAFRTIRTNLQFMSPDEDLKIIMITGAEKSVGKSTMASNLAITFAMTGNTTYLLDTDLRRPMLHQLFGLPNFQGLSSYLSGEKENLEELTAKCDQSGLYILPAGPIPPNPAEMLGSKRMSKVLENLQEKADIIIIDAPPILPVTDAVLLSQKVDGVIITAECNETRKDVFQKAQQRLEQVEANILGTILNKYPVNKSSYYTYENYYYYGEE